MEGHCLTGQNPQRAVAPMEEEEIRECVVGYVTCQPVRTEDLYL
jgi:hypothetical protein